jgi:hypothetical protein
MSPDDLESRSRCDAGDGGCAKAECIANTDACRLYGPYSSFRAREGEPPRAEGEPPGEARHRLFGFGFGFGCSGSGEGDGEGEDEGEDEG